MQYICATGNLYYGRMAQWSAAQRGGTVQMLSIAIMMGCAVLPHLRNLVNCIVHGPSDEQQKVRTMTALGLAAHNVRGVIFLKGHGS